MRLLDRLLEGFRAPRRRVTADHVWCPRRGEVGVEECLACGELRDFSVGDGEQWISCKPSSGGTRFYGGA